LVPASKKVPTLDIGTPTTRTTFDGYLRRTRSWGSRAIRDCPRELHRFPGRGAAASLRGQLVRSVVRTSVRPAHPLGLNMVGGCVIGRTLLSCSALVAGQQKIDEMGPDALPLRRAGQAGRTSASIVRIEQDGRVIRRCRPQVGHDSSWLRDGRALPARRRSWCRRMRSGGRSARQRSAGERPVLVRAGATNRGARPSRGRRGA
jgi:hypothetical protein